MENKILINYTPMLLSVFYSSFILCTNMYLFSEGDRVPNLSILICSFFGFFLSKDHVINYCISAINSYYNLFKKIIFNQYLYLSVIKIHIISLVQVFFYFLLSNLNLNVNILKNVFNIDLWELYQDTRAIWILKSHKIFKSFSDFSVSLQQFIDLQVNLIMYSNIINTLSNVTLVLLLVI